MLRPALLLPLLLAACTSQPAAPAASTAPPLTPFGLPTTIAPRLPASLAATAGFKLQATVDPPLPQRLQADTSAFAALATLADGILAKVAAARPADGTSTDVGDAMSAKLTVKKDFAVLQVTRDGRRLLALAWDEPTHGSVLYQPDDQTSVQARFNLTLGTTSLDTLAKLPGGGRRRLQQNFIAKGGGDLAARFTESGVDLPASGTPDRYALSVQFLNAPGNAQLDGAVIGIAGHQTPDGFDYQLGDGTTVSNVNQPHAMYALVDQGRFKVASEAEVPTVLWALLPQDGSLPPFPPDPSDADGFADPVDGVS